MRSMASDEHSERETLPIIHAGFIALIDCAPLVIAAELGLDRTAGFVFRLHREVSWANIRDKLELGLFECAHLLAPVAFASTLGLGRPAVPVIAPMALNLNGNAITVSTEVFADMQRLDPQNAGAGGFRAALALASVIASRQSRSLPPLTMGMVYPFSCHNYDLRCWLASAGIDPDQDVRLLVVPPPVIAESLRTREVDGFCAGAPWGQVAVAAGEGCIVATKQELWPRSPEKVLGVREDWAAEQPQLLGAVMQALLCACAWLERPENWSRAAEILSRPHYVGVPADIIGRILSGRILRGTGADEDRSAPFILFHGGGANMPRREHAEWILSQMVRWGQIDAPPGGSDLPGRIYRADLYTTAIRRLGMSASAVPVSSVPLPFI